MTTNHKGFHPAKNQKYGFHLDDYPYDQFSPITYTDPISRINIYSTTLEQ